MLKGSSFTEYHSETEIKNLTVLEWLLMAATVFLFIMIMVFAFRGLPDKAAICGGLVFILIPTIIMVHMKSAKIKLLYIFIAVGIMAVAGGVLLHFAGIKALIIYACCCAAFIFTVLGVILVAVGTKNHAAAKRCTVKVSAARTGAGGFVYSIGGLEYSADKIKSGRAEASVGVNPDDPTEYIELPDTSGMMLALGWSYLVIILLFAAIGIIICAVLF